MRRDNSRASAMASKERFIDWEVDRYFDLAFLGPQASRA
jgi:hypothetical protein